MTDRPTVLEICAGAGGQFLGLEQSGFDHVAAIEIDEDACQTLRVNRPETEIIQADVADIEGRFYEGIDLLAGGVPCPPFSIAGKQLGAKDERDLFPEALRLAREIRPKAIMIENVRGLASKRFQDYRHGLFVELEKLGYEASWRLLNASDFGLPQLRPRFLLVAMMPDCARHFEWPNALYKRPTVGEVLLDLMGARGWPGARQWAKAASSIGPTVVGGSKKHGGPDLGPTRAREDWRALGVDGRGLANEAPSIDFPSDGLPRLTIRMVARLQGFPDDWAFSGKKTAAYRQVGNAFPPPVASVVGSAILRAIAGETAPSRGQLRLVPSVGAG